MVVVVVIGEMVVVVVVIIEEVKLNSQLTTDKVYPNEQSSCIAIASLKIGPNNCILHSPLVKE